MRYKLLSQWPALRLNDLEEKVDPPGVGKVKTSSFSKERGRNDDTIVVRIRYRIGEILFLEIGKTWHFNMHDKITPSDPSERKLLIASITGHIHHLGKLSLEELAHILDCLSIHEGASKSRTNRRSDSEEL